MNTGKYLAYGLKAIAIFGGIAIGTGLSENVAQAIGIAISVAIGVDTLLTNQKTLVTYSTGKFAIESVLEEIEGKEREVKFEVDKLKDAGKLKEAEQKLSGFYQDTIKMINQKSKAVREAINKADIQALINLSVTPKS